MTTYTIEDIGGVKHTVVRYKYHVDFPTPKEWNEEIVRCNNGAKNAIFAGTHFATALPPLPRNPTKEHARLLHLYMAHGLHPHGKGYRNHDYLNADRCGLLARDVYGHEMQVGMIEKDYRITHAINSETGERVDIALEGDV